MPLSGLPRVFVRALACVSMQTLFNTFSAGPCVPALCELHTASRPPALASVRLVYPPIARGAPVARGSPCALRPAPRPLWQRPSGQSPCRPRRWPVAHPLFSLVKLGISRRTARTPCSSDFGFRSVLLSSASCKLLPFHVCTMCLSCRTLSLLLESSRLTCALVKSSSERVA